MPWFFFFSSRRRHTRCGRDWSSDVCSSDLSEENTIDSTISARNFVEKNTQNRTIDDSTIENQFIDEAQNNNTPNSNRSEERRVGKECRYRWSLQQYKKKNKSKSL